MVSKGANDSMERCSMEMMFVGFAGSFKMGKNMHVLVSRTSCFDHYFFLNALYILINPFVEES
jgi:hypothetical protein